MNKLTENQNMKPSKSIIKLKNKPYIKYGSIAGVATLIVGGAVWAANTQMNKSDVSDEVPSPSAQVIVETPTPTSSTPSTAVTPSAAPSASPTTEPLTNPATPPPSNHQENATNAYKKAEYSTAIKEYELAIKAESDSSNLAILWNLLGNSYRENNSSSDALKAYDSSISYNPKLGDSYLNKAAIMWSTDKREAAMAVLQTGIDAQANRQSDLENLLSVYKLKNK